MYFSFEMNHDRWVGFYFLHQGDKYNLKIGMSIQSF